jgi:hypothetical protein
MLLDRRYEEIDRVNTLKETHIIVKIEKSIEYDGDGETTSDTAFVRLQELVSMVGRKAQEQNFIKYYPIPDEAAPDLFGPRLKAEAGDTPDQVSEPTARTFYPRSL